MKVSTSIYGAHFMLPEADRTVAKIMRKVAHMGFDGIDLGYYWGEDKVAEMAEAKAIADGEGLTIANYIVGNNFGNAASESDSKLNIEIDKVKTALEEAAVFGCPALRVFAGGYNLDFATYSPKIAEALAKCVEFAEKANVVMALEDHGALCKNSKEQLFYINRVNSPYLRACVDIGNYWFPGGELPQDGVAAMAEYASMVHVKDYNFINQVCFAVPTGEGLIDFRKCFAQLYRAGYGERFVSLEYECTTGDATIGVSTSLANIRKFILGL